MAAKRLVLHLLVSGLMPDGSLAYLCRMDLGGLRWLPAAVLQQHDVGRSALEVWEGMHLQSFGLRPYAFASASAPLPSAFASASAPLPSVLFVLSRVCRGCGLVRSRGAFSDSQWKHPLASFTSRCQDCVTAATAFGRGYLGVKRRCSGTSCCCVFSPCLHDRFEAHRRGELGVASNEQVSRVLAVYASHLQAHNRALAACSCLLHGGRQNHEATCARSAGAATCSMRTMLKAVAEASSKIPDGADEDIGEQPRTSTDWAGLLLSAHADADVAAAAPGAFGAGEPESEQSGVHQRVQAEVDWRQVCESAPQPSHREHHLCADRVREGAVGLVSTEAKNM